MNLDFPRGFMPCFSYVEKVSRNCQASHSVVVVDHSPSSAIFLPWFILSSVISHVKKRFHWNCTLLIDYTVWPSQKTQHKFFKMYIWCCAFFFYVGPSHLRRISFHLLEWTKIHQAIFKMVRISSVLLSFLSIWPLNSISNLLFDLPQSIAYMLHGENYESINLKRMHGSFALASSVWNSFENCTRGNARNSR